MELNQPKTTTNNASSQIVIVGMETFKEQQQHIYTRQTLSPLAWTPDQCLCHCQSAIPVVSIPCDRWPDGHAGGGSERARGPNVRPGSKTMTDDGLVILVACCHPDPVDRQTTGSTVSGHTQGMKSLSWSLAAYRWKDHPHRLCALNATHYSHHCPTILDLFELKN